MENQVDKKFTWVIKNFNSIFAKIDSDPFMIGGCRWRLLAYRGIYLFLYLIVADSECLPYGWRRHVKCSLTLVNQSSMKSSIKKETECWFEEKKADWGFEFMIPLDELHDKDSRFLVNDELKIVAEVDVLKVIGRLDVPEEEASQPLKKIKRNDDGLESEDLLKLTSSVNESLDVDGFQLLPSQVEIVSRVITKYPDIALVFRAKNKPLRTACMYVFVSLIGTLRKPQQELSKVDLIETDNALTYLKNSGFKLDWLEKKLEEVKAKKKEEETRMQELEKELKDFKQKCSDKEAQLEKEKAKVFAARASPQTLDDII